MFLLRAVFWLSIVLLLIPGDPKDGYEGPGASAVDAILAARSAIADLSGMCTRQPDVCVRGGAALEAFGARARNGAAILYETFDGKPTEGAQAASEGEVALPKPAAAGTLEPADAAPAWREPGHSTPKA